MLFIFGGNNRARKGSAFNSLREHRLCSASPSKVRASINKNSKKKKELTKK